MTEYIDKEAAMPDLFCKGVSCQDCPFLIHPLNGGCRIADYIEALPAADVKPVVHGKWTIEQINTYELSYGTTAYEPVYRCSACGLSTESYLRLDEPIMPEDADFPKFCPNCGADMREVQP